MKNEDIVQTSDKLQTQTSNAHCLYTITLSSQYVILIIFKALIDFNLIISEFVISVSYSKQ